jgi:hypothetical protein
MRVDLVENTIVIRRLNETPLELKHAAHKYGPGRALAGH